MALYKIPEEYYFRIHQIRPRFKDDMESVLIYMAEEITNIGELPVKEFNDKVIEALYRYPGNANKVKKTMQNWRTEISTLFGFIENKGDTEKAGLRAVELAANQDLVEFFKVFLYSFQYPGAHIKDADALEEIKAGVHFKPAQHILRTLKYAYENEPGAAGITKAEACHCIFNDLRVTRDRESAEETWARIKRNRDNEAEYDTRGDIIRYAGDILDYMETANLLKTYDGRTYYLNPLENEAVIKFCESNEWFSGYDPMIEKRDGTLKDVKSCRSAWNAYVNRDFSDTDFSTDILAYIAKDEGELQQLRNTADAADDSEELALAEDNISRHMQNDFDRLSTKEIGDMGECLVYGHECMRIKLCEREDLIHLIKRIPTPLALGYDISSVEQDGRKRYIEVKTTISSKPLHFNRIHMTPNEWRVAEDLKDRYFLYRLQLSKDDRKLFLMQDPVGLYKGDVISMVPDDGADITFSPDKAGNYEELLTWEN